MLNPVGERAPTDCKEAAWQHPGASASSDHPRVSQHGPVSPALLAHVNMCIHQARQPLTPAINCGSIVKTKLMYCRFLQLMQSLYSKGKLALVAVDEAHCISSWGHDFRGAYRCPCQLQSRPPDAHSSSTVSAAQRCSPHSMVLRRRLLRIRRELPRTPIMALTATATEQVCGSPPPPSGFSSLPPRVGSMECAKETAYKAHV